MGVVLSISTIRSNLEDKGMTFVFLGYSQNHTGGTYCMLNLRTKLIVLSREIIWLNKTYSEYVLIKCTTKATSYILKEEDWSFNWYHIKMDTVKTEVNTENLKDKQNFKTEKYSRGVEDIAIKSS